jgi:hypothetical protein
MDNDTTPIPPSKAAPGPLDRWKEALPGGFTRLGWQLILAWLAFDALSGTAWALHLKSLAAWSALPNYWGELLTARDVWELLENGGLKQDPLGAWAPMLGFLSMLWVLWSGWKVQTRSVGLPARLAPWLGGLVETLLIGLPVVILGYGVSWVLEGVAASGIHGLGWLNLVGGTLFRLACVSAVMVQWWLCRIDRAGAEQQDWCLGSPEILVQHLGRSFQRLWGHPFQWALLVVGGVVVRLGLHFLVFLFAWKVGGGSSLRVWIFLGLQLAAAGVNAWLLGWFLRLTALFWARDARLRKPVVVEPTLDEDRTEHGLA